jgi:hypothetical protein
MKITTTNICTFGVPLIGFVVITTPVAAIELSIQPRFETGLAYYELAQEKLVSPTLISGHPAISISKVTSSDIMPFVGGGFALFADRVYLDFSAQHYFNGSDSSPVNSTNVNPAGSLGAISQTESLTTNQGRQDDNMQRTEWAISIGYSVTDIWSVYAGYKQAYTRIDSLLSGNVQTAPLTSPALGDPRLSGTYRTDARRAFDYDGPFVGSSLTWDIKQGWLDGALTGNLAVAFMDGQEQLTLKNFILTNQFGVPIPIDPSSPAGPTIGTSFKGDSVGVTLGLTWKGYTPVDNLTYSVGVVGYRYAFDSDSPASQNLAETLIRSNLNLAYTFDL